MRQKWLKAFELWITFFQFHVFMCHVNVVA